MVALWILGILLALIVAALFLRVGVRIAFGQELRVTAAAGLCACRSCRVPRKSPKTEKAQGEKESARKAEGSAPGEAEAGLTPGDIRSVLPYLWQSLKGACERPGSGCGWAPAPVAGPGRGGGPCRLRRDLRLAQCGGVGLYAPAGGADAYS